MADLQHKIKTLQGLLPSQRQWLERLAFQLEFNPYQRVHIIGGAGTGKSTLCLTIAELLSDDFNLALLKVETGLPAYLIRQHLLESWFGFCPDGNKPLMQLIGERQSNLPLALVLDQSENVPAELWQELSQVPCLVVAASLHPESSADLNLPIAGLTLEDAEQLLADQAFSTLSVSDRLAQAQGNIHRLLDPSIKAVTATKPQQLTFKPASIWPPLFTFVVGMAVIAAVVFFWFWTERDLRGQPGVGQLTYLPQEQDVVSSQPIPAPVTPSQSKAVVKELVDKLDVVKANGSSEASTMAQPERFEENSAGASPPNTEPSTLSETRAPTADAVTPTIANEAAVSANTPDDISVETNPESRIATKPAETPATETTLDELGSDELPVPAQQQLEPETTFEDEIAQELQSAKIAAATNTQPTMQAPASDELSIDAAEDKPVQAAVSQSYRFSEQALLAFSGEDKALQLVVFSNENALNSFKQTYAQLQTYTYARTKNGQKQLVVVMAPFADANAAKSQRSKLPRAFENAFVKSIAEIHSEISTN